MTYNQPLMVADGIIDVICDYFKITRENLTGKCRKREYVAPRQIAQVCIDMRTGLTLGENARLFGRHHSTVIHSKQTVSDLSDTDPEYKAVLDEVKGLVADVSYIGACSFIKQRNVMGEIVHIP